MQPLRILYLMTEPFGIGGVQSDLLAFAKVLCARGHQMTVISKAGPLVHELESRGAKHLDLDLWFHSPSMYLRAVREVRDLLRQNSYDVVAPQSVRSTLVTSRARSKLAARLRPPLITTVHNIHSKINYHTAGYILNRTSDLVIFESHYERDRLVKKGLCPEKSVVIHSGIDLQRFCPRVKDAALLQQYHLREDALIMGTLSRFSEEKGFPHLLSAFGRVAERIPTAVLMLVGDGPMRQLIETHVKKLHLTDRVILTGVQRDVPRYLGLFDVFALASTRESFPLSAREAMSAGVPVVATRVGGCHEVVENGVTGYLVPPADPISLAEAALKILSDKPLRAQMGQQGRKKAEQKFNEEKWIMANEAVMRQYAKKEEMAEVKV